MVEGKQKIELSLSYTQHSLYIVKDFTTHIIFTCISNGNIE